MPAEYVGRDFQEGLLEAGAVDFFFTPIQMKKGRPGLNMTVLVKEEKLKAVQTYLLERSSTIGLRHYLVEREELIRRQDEIDTPYGPVQIKEVVRPSGRKSMKIEYESLQMLAQNHHMSISELHDLLTIYINQSEQKK